MAVHVSNASTESAAAAVQASDSAAASPTIQSPPAGFSFRRILVLAAIAVVIGGGISFAISTHLDQKARQEMMKPVRTQLFE